MRTAALILALSAAVALACTGCTMPFSGERNVKFNLNILGNTIGWESTVAGQYTAESAAVETPVTQ